MRTILIVIALVFAGAAYYFYDGKTTAETELESKVDSLSKEKEKEIAQLKGTYNEFAARLKKEIAQGQIKIIQLSDRLSVIMVDKILFPSGEAEINTQPIGSFQRHAQRMLCDFCRRISELKQSFYNPSVCRNIIQLRAMKHRMAAVKIVASKSLCCRSLSVKCPSLQKTRKSMNWFNIEMMYHL